MIELAGIIILGITAQWLAWRTKVPAILPLILIGLLVGPISTLFTPDACKLIQPMYEGRSACNNFLFPGEYLFYFVSLAIGVILFEGGLTLRIREIRVVGPAILKLISIGSLVTFVGAGLAAHFLMGLSWTISFLFSGLIIVTGPTVIAPILQNTPLRRNISTVLKWEGILIDPIGALVAVLVFEFIVSGGGQGIAFSAHALLTFVKILAIGVMIGGAAALLLYQLLKYEQVPHYLLNVFTLALVLGAFVGSDALVHESGLLTVVVMGMVLGNLDVPKLKEILVFKESLSILLISILFILLAANIDIADLLLLLDWRCGALFLFVILVLRPLGVFLSTRGSELEFKEKIFISWVGPRGIVAAGIASLFGIKLVSNNVAGAEYITPLVFLIVMGTVLLNATTARFFARQLGLIMKSSEGIMIVGANAAARLIGRYLQDNQRHVVMIDNNLSHINRCRGMGLEAVHANIYNDDLDDELDLLDVGYLMALTSSAEVNQYAIKKFQRNFGELGSFRLMTTEELRGAPEELPAESLFSPFDDFINLLEVARDYPQIREFTLSSNNALVELLQQMKTAHDQVPLFLKHFDGKLDLIPTRFEQVVVPEGSKLVYMGREV